MYNRGFPDQSAYFDELLHNIDDGTVLCKHLHHDSPLDDINPKFNVQYNEELHGEKLHKEFRRSPILSDEQNQAILDLIEEFWCVFIGTGLFLPVKDYEYVIDTGSSAPIAVKKHQIWPL